MNGILDTAVEVEALLRETELQHCFIGGIALQRWGEPRMTLDLDLTVMSQFGNEDPVIARLLSLFAPRLSDAAQFAKQSRVLLLKSSTGVGIDIALGAMPFEMRMIQRSSLWNIDSRRSIRTCSAEDLIVQKAFAARDQDWVDIRGIIDRQSLHGWDEELVLGELQPLAELKDELSLVQKLREMLR